jgi:hypothetical protein
MGCTTSRVDKIINAFYKDDFDRVIQLCNFNNNQIDHHSITPYEIAEIIHILNTKIEDYNYNYLLANNHYKFQYEPLLSSGKHRDYIHFMINNVCCKMSCIRFIPVMVELLFKENVDTKHLERFIKNLSGSKYGVGGIHSSIVSYLCLNKRSTLSNQQLYTLLVFLKEKCDIHLNVTTSLSIYNYIKSPEWGNSILITLSKRNYAPLIQLLLDDGADYKQINKCGLTYYDYLNNDLKNHFKNYNPYGSESDV